MSPASMRPLGEIATLVRDVVDPAKVQEQHVSLFSIPAFDAAQEPEVTRPSEIGSAKLLVPEGAVLVSRLNPHIPRIWLTSTDGTMSLTSPEFAPLIAHGVTRDYLYAALLSRPFQQALVSRVNGTSTSHQRVKAEDLLSLPIPVPSAAQQRRIGSAIERVDRRLTLALRAGHLVDAVVGGRFRAGFSGAFRPDTQLGEFIDMVTGVSYRSAELGGEDQALVTLKCLARDGSYNPQGLKPWQGTPKPEQVVRRGDVVIAHTDLTQAADVLGRAVVVRQSLRYKSLVASLDLAVARPKHHLTSEYVFGLARQPEFRQYCKAHANGTTVLHLPRAAVGNLRIASPRARDVMAFTEWARPLLLRQSLIDDERQLLNELRDATLRRYFE
jgi:type I restriction enzyme S subunit